MMKFQVWLSPSNDYAFFIKEVSDELHDSLSTEGFIVIDMIEASSEELGESYFVHWCEDQSATPNKIERVSFFKLG